MQISGKCKIANKWTNGQVDKNSFDYVGGAKVGKGKLTWADPVQGKNGEKDSFSYSTKKFVCFGANIDFIEDNLDKQLEIVGNIKTVKLPFPQYKTEDGKAISYDEISIKEVKLAEAKAQAKHYVAKSNGYQPQQEEEEFDSQIPF